MNVLNEERLLPHVLNNIEPYVDEIVVVDGGPEGPSTDATGEIAKAQEKVVYLSGKYATRDGAWDMATQRNTAISSATGEVLLLLSADALFMGLDIFREAVEENKHKIYFCPVVEFWRDITSIRLHTGDGGLLTLPSGILEPIAIDRTLSPYHESEGGLNVESVVARHRVLLSQTTKFHLGWIRPFSEQVAKHIRHVKQHRWAEQGERLLKGSDRGLEQWAMLHVLGYANNPAVAYMGRLPDELDGLRDMRYDEGMDEATAGYQSRYGESIFKIMRGKAKDK
jgi:hypothetical protein